MARHITAVPLGKESASTHLLAPKKGPPVLGAKLDPPANIGKVPHT